MASVQVVVRLRPMNSKETKEGTLPVVTASTTNNTVTVIKGVGPKQARSQFSFDNVFTSFSTQQDVFFLTLRPVIADVLKGFETCVFAYGQTGTGKTHTMEGNLDNPDHHGVIPRAAQAIFDSFLLSQYLETRVSCSFLEIYNEELSDLLATDQSIKLDIVQTPKGVQCRGLSQHIVHSPRDVLKLMHTAVQARRVGETNMNKQSSRSHCIFTICVDTKQKLPNGSIMEAQGKLHMVDLAGSESAKTATVEQSSARDQAAREQERRNINKSLLTLGRVISILKDQSDNKNKSAMIPYRDSKLTRILQEALGGRCKTVIIATISPSIINVQESLQTLHYAQTAIGIKNKPVSNSYMSMGPSSSLPLVPSDGTVAVTSERWQEMEIRMEHMLQEVEEARHALARNYLQLQEMEERANKAECAQMQVQNELDSAKDRVENLESDLSAERKASKIIQDELHRTEHTLLKTSTILRATQETEKALTSEALALLKVLKESIDDGNIIYAAIKASHEEDMKRRQASRDFCGAISQALHEVLCTIEKSSESNIDFRENVLEVLSFQHQRRYDEIEDTQNLVTRIASVAETASNQVVHEISEDVIPKLETLCKQAGLQLNETKEKITDSEALLAKSCAVARGQLINFSEKITEAHENFEASVTNGLSKVENSLLESKRNVLTIVSEAEGSLKSALAKFHLSNSSLKGMLEQFKDSGDEAARRIQDISQSIQNELGDTHKMLQAEMIRHDVISKELDAQIECLQNLEESNLQTLESQSAQLILQQNQLQEAEIFQESLCNAVMETIICGVKNLVSEQIKLIRGDQRKRTATLRNTCSAIKDANDVMCGTSVELFHELRAANVKLREETKVMRKTDTSVLTALNSEISSTSSVHQNAVRHQKDIKEFANKALDCTETLNTVQDDIVGMQRRMQINGRLADESIDLSKSISKESISNICRHGSDAISFSKIEIIGELTKGIACIEEPRRGILSQICQDLDSVDRIASQCSGNATLKLKENINSIANMNQEIKDDAEKMNSTLSKRQHLHNTESKSQLIDLTKSYVGEMHIFTDTCKQHATIVSERTNSFGIDVLRMEEQVKPLPSKIVVDFSENLSSTPNEDVVLKDLPCTFSESLTPVASSVVINEGCTEESPKKSRVLRESCLNYQPDVDISPGKRPRPSSVCSVRRIKHKGK